MLEPEIETRAWDEQAALDGASTQLGYLFERSAFYREKLGAAGFASREALGGLADIVRLPLTDKQELRATCTPENPIGAHLCASRDEIVRIHSTSGTTGAPSYVPRRRPTSRTGSPGLPAATRPRGSRPASASSRPTTQGRSSQVPRSPRSTGSACATSPSGRGTPAAPDGDRAAATGRRRARPPTPRRSSRRPRSAASTSRRRASGACWWQASRAAASRRSGRCSRRAGARGSPRRWASATSGRRSGGVRGAGRDALGARGLVHAELVDPETGEPLRSRTARPGGSC